jgi:hypothetical protein
LEEFHQGLEGDVLPVVDAFGIGPFQEQSQQNRIRLLGLFRLAALMPQILQEIFNEVAQAYCEVEDLD